MYYYIDKLKFESTTYGVDTNLKSIYVFSIT